MNDDRRYIVADNGYLIGVTTCHIAERIDIFWRSGGVKHTGKNARAKIVTRDEAIRLTGRASIEALEEQIDK